MHSTIDKAGRLVIPRSLREEIGLPAGGDVEVSVRDGHVEVAPAPVDIDLVERDGFLAAEATGEVEPLTDDEVRHQLERGRR